jgi:TM2 domain-containing membrane protein YozV
MVLLTAASSVLCCIGLPAFLAVSVWGAVEGVLILTGRVTTDARGVPLSDAEASVAPGDAGTPGTKLRMTAGLFGFFLGGLGVHRFYLGYAWLGLLMAVSTASGLLLTCDKTLFGSAGSSLPGPVGPGIALAVCVWGAIEGALILTGRVNADARGLPLRDTEGSAALTPPRVTDGKSRVAAGLLALFFGAFGVHRLYLGYTRQAVLVLGLTAASWVLLTASQLMGRLPLVQGRPINININHPILAAWLWGIGEGIQILGGVTNADARGVPLRG